MWALLVLSGPVLQAQVRVVQGFPAQPNRPLNIPPSVTSLQNHIPPYMPNAPASVTSISPYNFNTRPFNPSSPYYPYGFHDRFNGCRGRGCGYGGYGNNGYGYGYAMPYYAYPYDPGYDASGDAGGPYLYSGPPGPQTPPAEQTLHIVVDQAPDRYGEPMAEEGPPAPRQQQQTMPEPKPGEPTILVYRDGHKQQVTNYAIMGQTLYVFDNRTKKIALAEIDVPATVKANDDQGVEFQLPKDKKPSKPAKGSAVPLQSAPDESPKTATSTATATP
jgi:hypothetical protein